MEESRKKESNGKKKEATSAKNNETNKEIKKGIKKEGETELTQQRKKNKEKQWGIGV